MCKLPHQIDPQQLQILVRNASPCNLPEICSCLWEQGSGAGGDKMTLRFLCIRSFLPHNFLRNSRIPPQLEKNHVVPRSWQEEALAHQGVSREVPCSALKGETVPVLQCSCLENPRDGGAWWAAIYGVAQSRTCNSVNWSKDMRTNCPGG